MILELLLNVIALLKSVYGEEHGSQQYANEVIMSEY